MVVGAQGDFLGHDQQGVADMNPAEQIEVMVEWFKFHFEDPANDTPYSRDHGGYVFLWGGPFDASEQIQEEFAGTVEFDIMQAAASQIESDGTINWAPTTQGAFYEHPEEEQDDSEEVDNVEYGDAMLGEEVFFADQDFDKRSLTEPEARNIVVEKLDRLQRQMAPIIAYIEAEQLRPPMMGHNNPPEELEIFREVSRAKWLETRHAVAAARTETSSGTPDRRVLGNVVSLLKEVARLLATTAGWIVVTTATGIIGTAAGGIVFDRANTIEKLTASSDAIQTWIMSLVSLF